MLWLIALAAAGSSEGSAVEEQLDERDLVLVRGERKKAPVVVQYSDWRCPHCLRALPQVVEAATAAGAELRFRNFPLDGACNADVSVATGHRCRLARASVCAHRLGRFTEFAEDATRSLDAGEEPWELSDRWLSVASACVDSADAEQVVAAQARLGSAAKIVGTPTFHVRVGKRWEVANTPDEVRSLLGL